MWVEVGEKGFAEGGGDCALKLRRSSVVSRQRRSAIVLSPTQSRLLNVIRIAFPPYL